MTDFGGTYTTGAISVANGGTTVTGTGTFWSPVVEQGDWLYCNGYVGLVASVTDNTHLELDLPWSGPDQSAQEYRLIKMSWLRYEPAITQAKVRALLAYFDSVGLFYFVSGDSPDPSLGDDGQFALKVNGGPWKVWLKIGGEWVLQGTPAGVNPRGAWDSATTYAGNDLVTVGGRVYRATAPSTNKSPPSNLDVWELFIEGGDRFDLASFDTDRPASGEMLVKIYPRDVTFPSGLPDSQAGAEIAATADAVFSITKNGTEFATITFSAGSAIGVFACAADTVFGSGDVLRIVAPSPRDETLSGVAASIIGFR